MEQLKKEARHQLTRERLIRQAEIREEIAKQRQQGDARLAAVKEKLQREGLLHDKLRSQWEHLEVEIERDRMAQYNEQFGLLRAIRPGDLIRSQQLSPTLKAHAEKQRTIVLESRVKKYLSALHPDMNPETALHWSLHGGPPTNISPSLSADLHASLHGGKRTRRPKLPGQRTPDKTPSPPGSSSPNIISPATVPTLFGFGGQDMSAQLSQVYGSESCASPSYASPAEPDYAVQSMSPIQVQDTLSQVQAAPVLQDVAMEVTSIDAIPAANPLVEPQWSSMAGVQVGRGWKESAAPVAPIQPVLSQEVHSGESYPANVVTDEAALDSGTATINGIQTGDTGIKVQDEKKLFEQQLSNKPTSTDVQDSKKVESDKPPPQDPESDDQGKVELSSPVETENKVTNDNETIKVETQPGYNLENQVVAEMGGEGVEAILEPGGDDNGTNGNDGQTVAGQPESDARAGVGNIEYTDKEASAGVK